MRLLLTLCCCAAAFGRCGVSTGVAQYLPVGQLPAAVRCALPAKRQHRGTGAKGWVIEHFEYLAGRRGELSRLAAFVDDVGRL